MDEEKYVLWGLIDQQPKQMLVDQVSDTEDGLSIILRHSSLSEVRGRTNKKIKILFDSCVAYRNMDESYRAKTLDDFPRGLCATFYMVKKSKWIDWLHQESKEIYSDCDIKHYSIVTIADWIDVLSEFPPEVSWIS